MAPDMVVKLSRADAQMLVYEEECDGWVTVDRVHVSDGRWSSTWTLVIRQTETGALYGAIYERGRTESCDPRPFERVETVQFRLMDAIPVTVVRYVYRKEAPDG